MWAGAGPHLMAAVLQFFIPVCGDILKWKAGTEDCWVCVCACVCEVLWNSWPSCLSDFLHLLFSLLGEKVSCSYQPPMAMFYFLKWYWLEEELHQCSLARGEFLWRGGEAEFWSVVILIFFLKKQPCQFLNTQDSADRQIIHTEAMRRKAEHVFILLLCLVTAVVLGNATDTCPGES